MLLRRFSERALLSLVLVSLMLASLTGIATPVSSPDNEMIKQSPAVTDNWQALINPPEVEDHSSYWEKGVTLSPPDLVYILVEPGIYPSITSEIDRYISDLIADGYTPELHTEGWADEMEVKSLLQTGYSGGMDGAVLVGDIPYAMYEMDDWFDSIYYGWTEFPIDLYLMDLDGHWIDSDFNEIFDHHTAGSGDLEPEIWVGRLYASTANVPGETEVSLLQNYFDKNHEYRMGNLSLYDRALVYVDDDWYLSAPFYDNNVGILYDNRTFERDKEITTALDYEARLDDNYDWISLFSHSNDWYHGLLYNDGNDVSYITNLEISGIDPTAHFYNLFCCHAGDFTVSSNSGYIGGHYLFSQNYSLGAVASTKTGSMLGFADFYTPLSAGSSIGEAFLDWFVLNGETGAGIDSRAWFYGMTLPVTPHWTPSILSNRNHLQAWR